MIQRENYYFYILYFITPIGINNSRIKLKLLQIFPHVVFKYKQNSLISCVTPTNTNRTGFIQLNKSNIKKKMKKIVVTRHSSIYLPIIVYHIGICI